MRRLVRSVIAIFLSLVLAAVSAALTFPNPDIAQGNLSSGAFFVQSTTTPLQQDESKIGSTDGIVVMGGVIALIILAPIFMRRKTWMQP